MPDSNSTVMRKLDIGVLIEAVLRERLQVARLATRPSAAASLGLQGDGDRPLQEATPTPGGVGDQAEANP